MHQHIINNRFPSGRPPTQRERVEAEHGKPMKQILIDLYNRYGSQSRIAAALGVGQSTVSTWLREENLVIRQVLVEDK